MSYDLFATKAPRYEPDEFFAALERATSGDVDAFDPSPEIVAFRRELLGAYPARPPKQS